MYVNTVGIGIKYSNWSKISKQRKLENSTDDINFIKKIVLELFNELYDKELGIRSLSVSLNDLDLIQRKQLSIFDKNYNVKNDSQKINTVIVDIEKKFGKNLLDFGSNKFRKN